MSIPVSRQLPQFCPRRVVIEEVSDAPSSPFRYWKVTIGGKSALLTFDEMLACVATFSAPRSAPRSEHPMFWSCFQSDIEREYEDRIRDSHWKLWHLGFLKPPPFPGEEVVW